MENFLITGSYHKSLLNWLASGMRNIFEQKGFQHTEHDQEALQLVLTFLGDDQIKPYRRKAQATFVVAITEGESMHENILMDAYPYLIRSLANHLMYVQKSRDKISIHFITPEQGCYCLTYKNGESEQTFFEKIYERLEPLARARLVIDNEFKEDLPTELWKGNEVTQKLTESGRKLDDLDLLPAPFPIENYLSDRDLRHLKKLYGIGGLSYGNLSARHGSESFWMSASGIDKSNMTDIGKDILYIKGYNDAKNYMEVSIPKEIEPKRASVDAIEHWMIYKEHPEVGAIVHVHAWMDGIKATEINYPCGTLELAKTVAELVRNEPNPAQAVIGLKNHGLTITGYDLDDIFERIEGKIERNVPMH